MYLSWLNPLSPRRALNVRSSRTSSAWYAGQSSRVPAELRGVRERVFCFSSGMVIWCRCVDCVKSKIVIIYSFIEHTIFFYSKTTMTDDSYITWMVSPLVIISWILRGLRSALAHIVSDGILGWNFETTFPVLISRSWRAYFSQLRKSTLSSLKYLKWHMFKPS